MTMPPDIANAVMRHDDCVHADPVFIALRKERAAFQAYSDALNGLARLGALTCETSSDELLALQEARLPELEAAEAKASAYLMEAEQELLATKPVSIEGAAALLEFLRKHLSEDPDINPVLESLGNIVDLLKRGQHGFVVPYNQRYL